MKIEDSILNIIFDSGKGKNELFSREGRSGEPFGDLPRPTRPGYEFLGWYLGEEEVFPETLISGDTDITVVGKWARKEGAKKVSVMKMQRLAVIVLSALIIALTITLLIVNRIIAVYSLTDTYQKDGVTYTETYKLKKQDGLYKLFTKDGTEVEISPNNLSYTSSGIRYEVYITNSGNLYAVNTSTGEYELYAMVDYDGSVGETVTDSAKNKRVMMYSQVKQDYTYSIEVENSYGTYKFLRVSTQGSDGNYTTSFIIDGLSQSSIATYDPEAFASLCVACGYATTTKLDKNAEQAPLLADGTFDLTVYGLDHPQAKYTITRAVYEKNGSATPGESYTVYIGNELLSGSGYYAKMEGRDAVYVVGSDLTTTVMQPIESLVTPRATYPMGVSTYSMVNNFIFGKIDSLVDLPKDDTSGVTLIADFSYIDLTYRENTMYSNIPYRTSMDLMKGYDINYDSVSSVLQNIYNMEFIACKKLGITKEALHEYHLDENVFWIYFQYDPEIANGGSGNYVPNNLIVSQKTENGTYYVASALYDMIVEVDQSFLSFVEWNQSKWYQTSVFMNNIAYIEDLTLTQYDTLGNVVKEFLFTLDNSKTDQSENVSSVNLEVFYGAEKTPLNQNIFETTKTDTGTYKTQNYTAVDNFRRLYGYLLTYSIEGDVDEAMFKKLTGCTMNEYIATHGCTASITYHAQDAAATANTSTDGEGNPVFTKNNRKDCIVRFYRYSETKMLMTVELLEEGVTPDPTKAEGRFYVDVAYWEIIMNRAQTVIEQEQMIPKSY